MRAFWPHTATVEQPGAHSEASVLWHVNAPSRGIARSALKAFMGFLSPFLCPIATASCLQPSWLPSQLKHPAIATIRKEKQKAQSKQKKNKFRKGL